MAVPLLNLEGKSCTDRTRRYWALQYIHNIPIWAKLQASLGLQDSKFPKAQHKYGMIWKLESEFYFLQYIFAIILPQ